MKQLGLATVATAALRRFGAGRRGYIRSHLSVSGHVELTVNTGSGNIHRPTAPATRCTSSASEVRLG